MDMQIIIAERDVLDFCLVINLLKRLFPGEET